MSDLSGRDFQQAQYEFAAHLRNPDRNASPPGLEDRRLKIYRELIYNNIESFLSSGFPILRSLIDDKRWHEIARDFVERHQSHTPYFLEISQEFLKYLQDEFQPLAGDVPFFLELAHYEWVELALDVAEQAIEQPADYDADVLQIELQVSPLAWRLSYQYPVHRIGHEFQPASPPDVPTFLVVYRNREHQVKFLEANAVTVQLLQLLEEQPQTGEVALLELAQLLGYADPQPLLQHGRELLERLLQLDIVVTA
ncbi:MAG: putative DNA-binding domain-containing protein [Porticoccaceae bacterium]